MSPEENFHVVIRIASKRPKGFVEPPSVKLIANQEENEKIYSSNLLLGCLDK